MEHNTVTKTISALKIILIILSVSVALSACGQRVYPESPVGSVHDSHSY
jgi:hypothetical protein